MGRRKGDKLSEEHKQKLRGKTPWNKNMSGEEYLKHYCDGKIWSTGLTKETSPSLKKSGEKIREYFNKNPRGKTWQTGLTKETSPSLKKMSESKLGDKNPNWFGNDVGYHGMHSWIRRNKLKPELCEKCKKVSPYDLANISGKYLRDLNDYEWLCRRCHMITDKRLNNLGKTKLTEEQVKEIKTLLFRKEIHINIAGKFNVGRSAITDINTGRTWKEIQINQKEAIII